MDVLTSLLQKINSIIWGLPMLILLLGTHLAFTIRLRFVQKKLPKAIRYSVTSEDGLKGDFGGFAALTTTLAATLGTGNIIGISTAVALGGPGAIFWCWITGLLGMATTYAECYLGITYRKKNADGSYIGGPMYVLEKGLHKKGLAVFFCIGTILASYGVGCSTQSNAITAVTSSLWNLPVMPVGFLAAVLSGFVLVGGISSIGKVCMKLVPAMSFFYFTGCILLLIKDASFILPAFLLILKSAFLPTSIAGGLIGSTILTATRYGVSRGLFTNEAGMGSAAITAAGAKTENTARQALISMTATFWDTVVMCALTGIVIVTNILHRPDSIRGISSANLTSAAFAGLHKYGNHILGISLIAFAIATILGWSYIGERAVEYLFGKKGIAPYRVGYLVMIFLGAVLSLRFVWELSDLLNALVVLPNLYALWRLRKQVKTGD